MSSASGEGGDEVRRKQQPGSERRRSLLSNNSNCCQDGGSTLGKVGYVMPVLMAPNTKTSFTAEKAGVVRVVLVE